MARFVRPRAALALALMAAGLVPIAGAGAATACSTRWSGGAGDGRWATAGNWTDGLPGPGSDVCVGGSSSYTVTADGGITVRSLSLDGTAGTQTLRIVSAGSQYTTVDTFDVGSTAVVEFVGGWHQLSHGGSGGSGTTNRGRIRAVASTVQLTQDTLQNLGTLEVGSATTFKLFLGASLTNEGTVQVAAGGRVEVPGGGSWTSSFDNRSGTIANDGTVTVQGGRFTQRDATTTGLPVTIEAGTWSGQGAGAGTFEITASATLEGASAPGQTLRVGSPACCSLFLDAPGGFTNGGTITTTSPSGGADVYVGPISSTWTNTGTLQLASPTTTHLRSQLVNRGTIAVQSGTQRADYPITLINDGGTVTTAAATALVLGGGVRFVHRAGTITNGGLVEIGGNYGSTYWDQEAGTITGNPVVLRGATWNGLGDGAGAFVISGSDNFATGRIAPDQTIEVADADTPTFSESTFLNVTDGFANDGALALTNTSSVAPHSVMVGPPNATLVNRGTLTTTGPATINLRLYVRNEGTLDARAGELRMDYNRTLTNNGTLVLRAGARLWTNGDVVQPTTSVIEFHASGPTAVGHIVNETGNPAGVPLGGRARPVFVAPYLPTAGTRLTIVDGAHQGTFATVEDGFAADVSNPAKVDLVTPAVFITTGAVPDGTVGQLYSVTLGSAWGQAPVAWSVTGGALPDGLSLSPSGTLAGTPTAAGEVTVDVTVTDSAVPANRATKTLTFRIAPRGSTTGLTSSANPSTAGASVSFTATVSGTSPGGAVEFRDGTTVLGTRPLTGGVAALTTSALTVGSHGITATYAGDANHTGSTSPTVTQTVNQPPAITSSATASFTIGVAGAFTAAATGSPAPTVTITGTLPNGLTVAGATIAGTPAIGSGGTYPLTVRAANGIAPDATQTLTLTVVNPFTAPAFTSPTTATFTRGTAGAFQVTASGNPAPVISVNGSLPAGLTITNGRIAGTPTVAGTFAVPLVATNGVHPAAAESLTLSILDTGVAPTITSPATATFVRGQFGSFQVTSTGNPAPTISVDGSLPPGLTISNGRISGIAGSTFLPWWLVSIKASNGVAPDAWQVLLIEFREAPRFTSVDTIWLSRPWRDATGGFALNVTARGIPAPTITPVSPLPPGMTFSNGRLADSGSNRAYGVYDVTFRASNGIGPDALQTVRILLGNCAGFACSAATPFNWSSWVQAANPVTADIRIETVASTTAPTPFACGTRQRVSPVYQVSMDGSPWNFLQESAIAPAPSGGWCYRGPTPFTTAAGTPAVADGTGQYVGTPPICRGNYGAGLFSFLWPGTKPVDTQVCQVNSLLLYTPNARFQAWR